MLIHIPQHETVLRDIQLSYQRQAGVSYFSFSVMLQNGIPITGCYDTVPDLRRTGMKRLLFYTLPKSDLKKWGRVSFLRSIRFQMLSEKGRNIFKKKEKRGEGGEKMGGKKM